MAHITQNNIYFGDVDTATLAVGSKVSAAKYQVDENGLITGHLPIINAIDIDWDAAEMTDGTVIDTTGQLLNYISFLKTQIDALKANLPTS